jgi:hypothetical protein
MRLPQPDLKRLQDKYKGKTDQLSRQAMAREQMALYKQHWFVTDPLKDGQGWQSIHCDESGNGRRTGSDVG